MGTGNFFRGTDSEHRFEITFAMVALRKGDLRKKMVKAMVLLIAPSP